MDVRGKKRKIVSSNDQDKRLKYDRDESAMSSFSSSFPRQNDSGTQSAELTQAMPHIVVDEVCSPFYTLDPAPYADIESYIGNVSVASSLNSDGEDHYSAPERINSFPLLPDPFSCSLQVTLDGVYIVPPPELLIPWKDEHAYGDAYDNIEEAVARCLESSPELGSRQWFLKHGSCRTISDSRVDEARPLETRDEWMDMHSILVTGYRYHSVEGYCLEIVLNYSAIQINPHREELYYKHMQKQIQKKMKDNFSGKQYIPRIDRINIATADNIRRMIESYPTFHELKKELKDDFDPGAFIHQVQHKAPTLFLICIFYDIEIQYLKLLLDKEISDQSLPLDADPCPHSEFSREFRQIRDGQGGFLAHSFTADHKTIHPRIVVPVIFDKEKDRIGRGGFSDVYRARIDPDHLRFSKDKNQTFAIKEFREHLTIEADFNREQKMLQELRKYSHHHIVVHFTSWIQDKKFYLVFPHASCNLREHMVRVPEPILNRSFVLWILQQFHGLADAIRHVHNLNDKVREQNTLAAPRQPGVQQGYHHDIKPENILLFQGKNLESWTLKIADFGLGKVHNLRSGSRFNSRTTQMHNAHPTYEAPDGFLNGRISRPADMWALGCVFLEILVWIFEPSEPEAGKFASDRDGPDPRFPKTTDDAFWSVTEDGEGAIVRRGVTAWFERVEKLSSGKRAFQHILEYTKELLHPNTAHRLDAIHLENKLDALVKQAKSDLAENPDLYLQQDVTFPSEGMLPSRTRPPSPAFGHSSPGSPPALPHIAVSNGAVFTNEAVASPMDVSSPHIHSHQRRSSYKLTLGLPEPQYAGGRSRDNSYSSDKTIISQATHGSRPGSGDDYKDVNNHIS